MMKGIPGDITPDGKYVEKQVIPCYMTDGSKQLKPAGFMDIAQEMGFRAATAMHFGYDDLIAEGKAWVLSRLYFRYVDMIYWRDEVTVSTWNRGPIGPFFYRDFRVQGEHGLLLATSAWLVLDLYERTIARHAACLENIPPQYQCDEAVLDVPAAKIVIPKSLECSFVRDHVVDYADVDMLGHTNNARYMVWAMDCIGYEQAEQGSPAEVWINFNHEARPGDVVSLYRAQDGNTYYVEGKVGDSTAFLMKIAYQ